ncbi:MAG: DUF4157 domain-containing protein [Blastocatellia bacterium]
MKRSPDKYSAQHHNSTSALFASSSASNHLMGSERIQAQRHQPASAENSTAHATTASRQPAGYAPQLLCAPVTASPDGVPLTRDNLLYLQRTIGNRAVNRLIQAKLEVGQPGDEYEREADQVAEQVLRMPEQETAAPARSAGNQIQRFIPKKEDELQRQAMEEEEEQRKRPKEEDAVQMKPSNAASLIQRQATPEEEQRKRPEEEAMMQMKRASASGSIQRQAANPEEEERKKRVEEEQPIQAKEQPGETPWVSARAESQIERLGGGEPIPESTRAFFEGRFGRDFSQVRVHNDAQAAGSARAINAKAYTTGNEIVFGAGEYAPETGEGKKLLAHELAHTIQQGAAGTYNSATPTVQRFFGLNPFRLLERSQTVPDLTQYAVQQAEEAIKKQNFQDAIDWVLLDAFQGVSPITSNLLEGGTMTYDPSLKDEGMTKDPSSGLPGQSPTKARVTIGPSAFKQGVAFLYSTMLHEFFHVQQAQPIGPDNPMLVQGRQYGPGGIHAREVEAYAREILHAEQTGLAKSPRQLGILWDRLILDHWSYLMALYKKPLRSLVDQAFAVAQKYIGKNVRPIPP